MWPLVVCSCLSSLRTNEHTPREVAISHPNCLDLDHKLTRAGLIIFFWRCISDKEEHVAKACNPKTWEVKVRGSEVKGQLWLQRELEVRLDCMRPCLKMKTKVSFIETNPACHFKYKSMFLRTETMFHKLCHRHHYHHHTIYSQSRSLLSFKFHSPSSSPSRSPSSQKPLTNSVSRDLPIQDISCK